MRPKPEGLGYLEARQQQQQMQAQRGVRGWEKKAYRKG